MTNAPILPAEPKKKSLPSTLPEWIGFPALLVIIVSSEVMLMTDSAPEVPSWLRALWLMATMLVVWFAVAASWLFLVTRRFNVVNLAALELFARGDVAGALTRFEALEQIWRSPRMVRIVVRVNHALMLMHQGDLWLAIHHYGVLDAQRQLREKSSTWSLMAGHMAHAHALVGALDAADAWLAEVELRAKAGDVQAGLDAGVEATRAVLGCRRGNAALVASRLASEWLFLDRSLTGINLRPLRAVRAFALASSGDCVSSEAQLVPLREGSPNEFAYLGAQWPEMRAFLEQHGLVADSGK